MTVSGRPKQPENDTLTLGLERVQRVEMMQDPMNPGNGRPSQSSGSAKSTTKTSGSQMARRKRLMGRRKCPTGDSVDMEIPSGGDETLPWYADQEKPEPEATPRRTTRSKQKEQRDRVLVCKDCGIFLLLILQYF